jgi:DNA-binding MarR family transcriptional regulator
VDETRWLDADEQRAWRAYLDATRLLLRALDQQLEEAAGISFTDYELLVHLADAAMSTRSGVTRAVTRLEQSGWVRRVTCEDDRRGTHAELTRAGAAKLAAAAPGHVAAVRAHLVDRLSPAQVRQVAAVFGKLSGSLQRPHPPGPADADGPVASGR